MYLYDQQISLDFSILAAVCGDNNNGRIEIHPSCVYLRSSFR
jgi:hypothetical protein